MTLFGLVADVAWCNNLFSPNHYRPATNQTLMKNRPLNARRFVSLNLVALSLTLAFFAPKPVSAQTDRYWSGGGASDNISDGNNWFSPGGPAGGDNLNFNNTTGSHHFAYDDSPGRYFGTVISYSGSGATRLYGASGTTTYLTKFENNNNASLFDCTVITLANRTGPDTDLQINPVGTGGVEVNNVLLQNGKTLFVYGANTLTVNGVISQTGGTASMVAGANGNSTVILKSANTFSGTTYVNNGTLRASISGALGSSAVTLGDTTGANGAALNLDGGLTWNGQTTTVRSGSSGIKTLANTASTTGIATYNNNLVLNTSASVYANSGGQVTLSGTTLDLQGNTLTVDGPGTNLISGVLTNSTGTGAVTKQGAGTLTLSASNGFSGQLTVSAGTLAVPSVNISSATVPGPLGMSTLGVILGAASGGVGTLEYTGVTNNTTSTKKFTLATGGTGVIQVDNNINLPISGAISGSGNLIKTGVGTLTITGVNTYTGTTTISNGIYAANRVEYVNVNGPLGKSLAANPGSIVFGGGTLQFFTAIVNNDYSGRFSTAANQPISVDVNGTAVTFATALTSSGGTLKLSDTAGGGTLTLSGANTYTGTSTLNGGTLSLGIAETAGTSGPLGKSAASNPGSIVLGGGKLQYTSVNQNDYSGRFSTAASQAYNIDANGQALTLATALSSSGGTLTLTSSAAGGILTLSGANSYDGLTTVSAGILKLNNATALGTTAAGTTVAAGGALDLNGQTIGAEALTFGGGGVSGTGAITNSSSSPASLSGALTMTVAASIGGVGDITLSGGFTGGAGSFNLTNNGGKLILPTAATTRNGSGTIITVNNGGTIRLQDPLGLSTGGTHLIVNTNGGILELAGGIIHNQPTTDHNNTTLRSDGSNEEDGKMTMAAGASVTYSTLHASDVFTIGNGANDVSGGDSSSTISIAGPGTVLLGQTANYVGNWNLTSGTTQLGATAALGATPASTVTLATGATLSGHLASTTTFTANPITISGSGTTTIMADRSAGGAAVGYTFGSLGIGGQTLVVTNGPLQTSGAAGAITLGAVTLTGSPTFDIGIGTGGATAITLTTGVIDDGASSFSITKNGSGTFVLTNANTFDGGVVLNAGLLNVNHTNALGTGTLTINGGSYGNTSALVISNNNNNAVVINGDFADPSAYNVILGTGNISLGTTAGTSRTITISGAGTLQLDGVVADGTTAKQLAFNVSNTGGQVNLYGTNTYSGGLVVKQGFVALGKTATTAGGQTYAAGTNAVTLGDPAGGSAILGVGSYTLTNAINLASGAAGNLSFGAAGGTRSPFFTGPIALNGNNLVIDTRKTTGNMTVSGNITGTGNLILTNGAAGNLFLTNNTINNVGTITLYDSISGATNWISGNIGANVTTVTVASGAHVLLSGTNTYTGDTTVISTGDIVVNSDSNLGAGANVNLGQNTTFAITASFATSKNFVGSGTTATQFIYPPNSTTLTINGTYTGVAPKLTGPGTLQLNGSNYFSGASTPMFLVDNGKLALGNAAALNGAVLKYNPAGSSLDNVTGSPMVPTGFMGLDLTTSFNFLGSSDLDLSGAQGSFVQTATTARTISVAAHTLKLSGFLTTGTAEDGEARVDAALTKTGAGTLYLNGTSDYTGATTVSVGTLFVNGTLGNTAVGVASAATLGGGGTIGGAVTMNSGSFLAIGGGVGSVGTLTLGSTLALNGQPLTFDLSSNPASGNDQINVSGVVSLTSTTTIALNSISGGVLGAGTYTLMTYASGSGTSYALDHAYPNVTMNAGATSLTITVGTGGSVFPITWAGDGSGNAWDIATTSNWTNNYTGARTVYSDGADVTFNDTATNGTVNLNTSVAPATVTVNATANYTITGSGSIGGGGTLTKSGSGTLTLANTNAYNGGTTLSTGTLALNTNNCIGSGTLNIGGGTISSLNATITNAIAINASFTIPGNSGVTVPNFSGPVTLGTAAGTSRTITESAANSGTGSPSFSGTIADGTTATKLIKAGGGGLVLSGSNTFSGGLDLNAGVLAVNHNNALGSGTLTIAGSTTISVSGANSRAVTNAVTVNGDFTMGLNGKGVLTLAGAVDFGGGARSITVGNANGEVINGDISNGTGLIFTAASVGSLTLGGNNTFTGQLAVGSGTTMILQVASDANLGSVTNVSLAQNSSLKTTASFPTSKTFTLSGANPHLNPSNGVTLTLNGQLTSPSSTPIFNGAGNLTLNASNNFITGSTLLNSGGTLNLGHAYALNHTTLKYNGGFGLDNTTGGPLTPLGMEGLDLTGGFTFVGTDDLDLSGVQASFIQTAGNTRIITVSAKTLKLSGILTTGTTTGSGVARQDGGLNKGGAGTLILTSTSDYTGNTTNNLGTLLVNGSLGTGLVVVSNTAILGGNGTINGPVTVASNGILQPGAGGSDIATLTINNNLTLSGTNIMVIDRAGSPNASLLAGISTLTLGGKLIVTNAGAALQANDSFTLYSASSVSGNFSATNLPALASTLNWWQIVTNTSDIALLVNTKPVASDISMGAQTGVLQTLPIIGADKHAPSDADGNPMTLSGVTQGTNGGVVTISGNNVTYSNNVAGADSFTYTVSDNHGGSATATVLVNVTDVVNQQATISYTGGTVSLTFWGVPGTSYTIQRATDVGGPWTDLTPAVTASSTQPYGQIPLSDTPPANGSYFYRLKP